MFDELSDTDALILIKRGNTAHEEVFTIRRSHVRIFGDMSTPSVLSRIIYWSGKSHLEGGWFYKTAEEMARESCLSVRTIHNVKDKLMTMGVVDTKVGKVGETPVLHWKLNPKVLLELEIQVNEGNYQETMETANLAESESAAVALRKVQPLQSPLKEQKDNLQGVLTEHNIGVGEPVVQLEEKKPKVVKKTGPLFSIPEWVPQEKWQEFVAMRSRIGYPLTDGGKKYAVDSLVRLKNDGEDIDKVMEQSIFLCYRGFFKVNGEGLKHGKDRSGSTQSNASGKANSRSTKYANVPTESF